MSMCLTIPYKIIQIQSGEAVVENGKLQRKKVNITPLSDLKKGDWVLVNADLAIQKVSTKEAAEINSLLNS